MKNQENEKELRHQFDQLVENQLSAIKKSMNSKKKFAPSQKVSARRSEKEKIENLKLMASQGDLDSFNELLRLDVFMINNGIEKCFAPVIFIDWYKSCLENVKKSGSGNYSFNQNDLFAKATRFLYEQTIHAMKHNGEHYSFWQLFYSEMSSSKRSPMVEALLDINDGQKFLKDVLNLSTDRVHVSYNTFFIDFLFFKKKINYYNLETIELDNFFASKVVLASSIANDLSNQMIKKIKAFGCKKDVIEKMCAIEYFSKNKYEKEKSALVDVSSMSEDDVLRKIIAFPVNVFDDFYLYFQKHKNLSVIRSVSCDYLSRFSADYDLLNKLYLSSDGLVNVLNSDGFLSNKIEWFDKRLLYVNLNETLLSTGVLNKVELILLASLKEHSFREKLCQQCSGPLFNALKEVVTKLYSFDDQVLFHWLAKNEVNANFVEKTVGLLDKNGQHYCCYKVLTMFDVRESFGFEVEKDMKMAIKNVEYLKKTMSNGFWSKRKSVYKAYTPNMHAGQSIMDYLNECKKKAESGTIEEAYFKKEKFERFLIQIDKAAISSAVKAKGLPRKKFKGL